MPESVLRVMGSWKDKEPGDYRVTWDSTKLAEVEAARKTFNDFKAKGYLAYSVKQGGDKGSVIKEFDPYAEKIIMAMPLVGG